MAAKSKARTLLIRLVSTARTGYFYVATKNRLHPTMSRMKYDPKVKKHVLFIEKKMK